MPVPGQGSQCCPSLARGLLEGLFERVCYKRRVARRIETDFPSPSRCPAGNSTPWLCRNNLLLQLYREGGVGFARFFWLPPPSVFFVHKGSCSLLALLALRSSRRELPLQKARARGQKLSGSTRSRNTRVLS